MKKILLMLTGGTICSFINSHGFKDAKAEKAAPLLIDHFKNNNTDGFDVDFDVQAPLNILSENMTVEQWNVLLNALSDLNWENYKGIIIAHGTDTLAYTASLLSIVLAGCPVPVFLVSSNFGLSDKRANGNQNFKAAVELIEKRIVPNVYIPYKNSDGITYLHKGAEITQCQNYTWNFYSKHMEDYKVFNNRLETKIKRQMILNQMQCLKNNVLMVEPYVGIDYSAYNLQGKKAVIHGLFHSSTACIDIVQEDDPFDHSSVLYIINKCKEKGIGFFVTPFEKELFAEEAMYSSTGMLFRHGAIPIVGMTKEVSYAKLLVAYTLFQEQNEIVKFLKEDINAEIIY